MPFHGNHGVVHWARVLENGLRIAEDTGADREVVALFALFHDARRVDENRDDDHGLRDALFAQSLRGTLIYLDDTQFDLLFEACRLHADGLTTGERTLLTCRDADRLDLGRVGIVPSPRYLGTKVASNLIPWGHVRAVEWYVLNAILASGGVGWATGPIVAVEPMC